MTFGARLFVFLVCVAMLLTAYALFLAVEGAI